MNSNVIQLISMLLCIAVVVCFFIFNYNRGVDVQDSKAKVQKLHLFYISGILVFIIIELATGLCMGNAKHDDILSYVEFCCYSFFLDHVCRGYHFYHCVGKSWR